ncbi:hypothetical protein ABZ468_44285 [Streptomyces sp. NPDC005708]
MRALPATDQALPYRPPGLGRFLTSQMVRRLHAHTVITPCDLPDL